MKKRPSFGFIMLLLLLLSMLLGGFKVSIGYHELSWPGLYPPTVKR